MDANGITTGYLSAMLWVVESDLSIPDLDPEAALEVGFAIGAWVYKHQDLLEESGLEPEQIGHDLYLTSNHHGAGFWDRGLGELGDRLTEAAAELPEFYPVYEETSWDVHY